MSLNLAVRNFTSKVSRLYTMPVMVARGFTGVSQVLCANDKSAKPSKAKATKSKKSAEKETVKAEEIPKDQGEYDKFIATYRNEEQFHYNFYSYYDVENELLSHRQPQPKKPALY